MPFTDKGTQYARWKNSPEKAHQSMPKEQIAQDRDPLKPFRGKIDKYLFLRSCKFEKFEGAVD